VYFAPAEGSPLERFGAAWLGRSPTTGQGLTSPDLPGLPPERQSAITAAPRRYGFHATLKPPFQLAEASDEPALVASIGEVAARHRPFAAPRLTLVSIGGFIALVLSRPSAEMQALCDDCVASLDRFRRPAEPGEVARRREAGLSARQEALLARWGYPYVMEEFQFHLTLTDRLAEPEHSQVKQRLADLTAGFCTAPLPVNDLCLFVERPGGRGFRIERRFRLGG
jgi:putative phosphonate metabolism protein